MALQSSFYNTDGTTRTYPSTKHIATKQHVSVYGKRVSDSTWVILAVDLYELVNNSIVFDTAPDTAIYSQIEVRVADTAIELEDSPSDIAIVAGIAANVSTVAGNTTNINTVATNIGAIQTVSGNTANVTTVATNIANVNTVAGNNSNVTTVAGISGNVTTVAGISANVTTVAGNTANINTVATDISAVTTVANDLNEPVSEIETVAGSIANVNTVGTAIANVNTVAGSITNVNTVGTNIANVNSVAITVVPNIAEILLADDNAITATAKALEAQHWANYTTDVAVPEGTGEFSAKHYSVKASEYAASVNPSNIMHLTGNESASGVKTFTSGINAPQLVGFKNYIINGNMSINQRTAVDITPATNTYFLDRWETVSTVGSKLRFQVDTDAPIGSTYSTKISVASQYSPLSTDSFQYRQKIEGFNTATLGFGASGAKTVTLPFYAKASVAGKYSVSLRNADSTRSIVGTVNLTGAWQRVSVTFSGDTSGTWLKNESTGLNVAFDLGSGSNYTTTSELTWESANKVRTSDSVTLVNQAAGASLWIAQVQLEEGSVATPFEQRPYGLELSLCQRYYEVGTTSIFSGNVTSGGTYSAISVYKVKKRTVPTVVTTDTGNSGFAIGSPIVVNNYADSFTGVKACNSTLNAGYFIYSYTASAEL